MSTTPIPLFNQSIVTKFWSKIEVPILPKASQCWNWLRAPTRDGYGKFSPFEFSKTLGTFRAHRVAYFLTTSDDPKDYMVLHTCDNRLCCNPSHLYKGTHTDNMRDMLARHRSTKGRPISPQYIKRGEQNPTSKLTENAVREIKLTFQTSRLPRKQLQEHFAKKFQVSTQAVEAIYLGRNWKHVVVSVS